MRQNSLNHHYHVERYSMLEYLNYYHRLYFRCILMTHADDSILKGLYLSRQKTNQEFIHSQFPEHFWSMYVPEH